MTFATIMVSVDFDQASKARISLAADLAVRFKSVLIGVAGWPLLKPDHKSVSETELPSTGSAESVSNELKHLGEKFRKIAEDITDRVVLTCNDQVLLLGPL